MNGSILRSFSPATSTSRGSNEQTTSTIESLRPEHWSINGLQTGIFWLTLLQGSIGGCRVYLGDVFGGAYALLLATLGFNSRYPGPAVNWLKTYILITFINGTVGTVDLTTAMLSGNVPLIIPYVLPLKVNIAHLIQLSVPFISFSSAYIGWQYIKSQK
jgi:hypothetical protein